MKVAIIGLPQSGKTTLTAAATNYMPDRTGKPQVHLATVKVPDSRLTALAQIYHPKKIIQATIELIDTPGLSLADHKGREDFRRFLPEVRQAQMLLIVIRAFDNPAVPAHRGRVAPAADLKEICDELYFADFDTVTKRLEKVEKNLKKPTETHDLEKRQLELLRLCRDTLEENQPLSTVLSGDEDQRLVSSLGLLTVKPWLVVYNLSEDQASTPDTAAPPGTAGAMNLCAKAEWDIAQLDPADRPAFLADLGIDRPAREHLIQKCYDTLGLISFLTAGVREVRAWTIKRGTPAVEAAGKVHSDIARGFIRAETVAFDDFAAAGDMKTAKTLGKVRLEGKSYVVQDGDIIDFKFNV